MVDNKKQKKYLMKFKSKWGNSKQVVSEYLGSNKPIKIKCLECDDSYVKKYASEAIRYGCPICYKNKRTDNLKNAAPKQNQSTEEFKLKLSEKCNNKYSLVGEYLGMRSSSTFRCNKCQRVFKMRPDDLLYRKDRGCNCQYFRLLEIKAERKKEQEKEREIEKKLRDEERIKKFERERKMFSLRVKAIWGNEFELLSPFKGKSHKIKVRHRVCGKVSKKEAKSLLDGYGCKYCSKRGDSSGVIIIARVLQELNLQYKREVTLEDCRYKKVLPFDFGIYNKGKELFFLIEYDGEQHFRATKRFGGDSKLRLIQLRDKIKDEYCRDKEIPLLRVKYNLVERTNNPYESVKSEIQTFIKNLTGESKVI